MPMHRTKMLNLVSTEMYLHRDLMKKILTTLEEIRDAPVVSKQMQPSKTNNLPDVSEQPENIRYYHLRDKALSHRVTFRMTIEPIVSGGSALSVEVGTVQYRGVLTDGSTLDTTVLTRIP